MRPLLQEKLAELADAHGSYVGGVVRGERSLSLRKLVKVADGETLDELVDSADHALYEMKRNGGGRTASVK